MFRRSAIEDEINRGWYFGLDNMPLVHSACCSAEESLLDVTQGGTKARQTRFRLPLYVVRSGYHRTRSRKVFVRGCAAADK
ncbi:MAG: hypothetical protein SH868_07080, partial [Bythopirellula sp.]|nr:hypothetical protein [Bythopirellula sp.]